MDIGDIDFSNIDWNGIGRVRDYNDYGGATGAIVGLNIFTSLISLAIVVLMIVALWKVFTKAGKPGWHALIPFLNMYTLFMIAWKKKVAVSMLIVGICSFVLSFAGALMFVMGLGGSFLGYFAHGGRNAEYLTGGMTMFFVGLGIMLLGACCSLTVAVFMIINYVKLGKAFGKSGGFLVGMALIPPVFLCILAFGKAQYYGYWDNEGYHPDENYGNGGANAYAGNYYYNQPQQPQPPQYAPPKIDENGQYVEAPRYCSGCGTQIVPGSKFCSKCGKQLFS